MSTSRGDRSAAVFVRACDIVVTTGCGLMAFGLFVHRAYGGAAALGAISAWYLWRLLKPRENQNGAADGT